MFGDRLKVLVAITLLCAIGCRSERPYSALTSDPSPQLAEPSAPSPQQELPAPSPTGKRATLQNDSVQGTGAVTNRLSDRNSRPTGTPSFVAQPQQVPASTSHTSSDVQPSVSGTAFEMPRLPGSTPPPPETTVAKPEVDSLAPITDEEAEAFAVRWSKAVSDNDTDAAIAMGRWKEIGREFASTLSDDAAIADLIGRPVIYEAVPRGLITALSREVAGGHYEFVRSQQRGDETYIVMRALFARGLDYHEIKLVRADGEVKLDSMFLLQRGVKVRDAYSRVFAALLSRDPEMREKLPPEMLENAEDADKLVAVWSLLGRGDVEGAAEMFSRMSDETKQTAAGLSRWLEICQSRGLTDESLETYEKLAATDFPRHSLALRGLDMGVLLADETLILNSGNELQQWLGGDPYLNLVLAAELAEVESFEQAKQMIAGVDLDTVTGVDAVLLKIQLAIAIGDYAEATRQLVVLGDEHHLEADLSAVAGAEDYLASEAHKSWEEAITSRLAVLPSNQYRDALPIEPSEVEAWSNAWEDAIEKGDSAAIESMVDWESVLEQGCRELVDRLVTAEVFRHIKTEHDVKETIRGVETGESVAYRLATMKTDDPTRPVLVFRSLGDELNYHQVTLARSGEKVVATEIYSAADASSVAWKAAHQAILQYARTVGHDALPERTAFAVDSLKMQEQLILAYLSDPERFAKAYDSVPDHVQLAHAPLRLALTLNLTESKRMQLLRWHLAHHGAPAFFGIHGIQSRHALENAELLSKYHLALKQWTHGDGFLDLRVGVMLVKLGQIDEAVALTLRADPKDVGLVESFDDKFTIAIASGDHVEAVRSLSLLGKLIDEVPIPSQRKRFGFEDFEKSDTYKVWQATREEDLKRR